MSSIITIEDAENRPWLVMVHGMSQNHRYFGKQVEAFKSLYRILLIDLPGHGLSSALGGPFGHIEFAAHVERILDTPRFGSVHYWGTHTGGTVGVLLGLRRPDLIRSLLLEAPSVPGQNPPIVTSLIARAQNLARTESVGAALDFWWNKSPWFDSIRENPARYRAAEHCAMVSEFDARPWIETTNSAPVDNLIPANCQRPVMIYQGEHDHPEFFKSSSEVGKLLLGAQFKSLPGLGGFPAWESPKAVNAVAWEFLSGVDASPTQVRSS